MRVDDVQPSTIRNLAWNELLWCEYLCVHIYFYEHIQTLYYIYNTRPWPGTYVHPAECSSPDRNWVSIVQFFLHSAYAIVLFFSFMPRASIRSSSIDWTEFKLSRRELCLLGFSLDTRILHKAVMGVNSPFGRNGFSNICPPPRNFNLISNSARSYSIINVLIEYRMKNFPAEWRCKFRKNKIS